MSRTDWTPSETRTLTCRSCVTTYVLTPDDGPLFDGAADGDSVTDACADCAARRAA